MDRTDFVKNFSNRLNSLLQKKNTSLNGTKNRVQIKELAEVTGVSYQMTRKYILGLALPDYHIIPKIANWFNVSCSWLLFGETETFEPKSSTLIELESELLKYILLKCMILFPQVYNTEKNFNFIYGIIYDASHINADHKTLINIIDMMITSAIQLSGIHQEKRA